jgi:hypothetical protein
VRADSRPDDRQETIMYPYPEIPRARIAELHHQAERDARAIAIRRAHRAPSGRSRPAWRARLACAIRRALALVRPRCA